MLLTWRSTVRSLITSSPAISRFVRPRGQQAEHLDLAAGQLRAARAGLRPERAPDPGEIRPRAERPRTLARPPRAPWWRRPRPRARDRRARSRTRTLAASYGGVDLVPRGPRPAERHQRLGVVAARQADGAVGARGEGVEERRVGARRRADPAPSAAASPRRGRRRRSGSRRTVRGGAGAQRVDRLVDRPTDRGERRWPADPARGGGGRGRVRAGGRARRPDGSRRPRRRTTREAGPARPAGSPRRRAPVPIGGPSRRSRARRTSSAASSHCPCRTMSSDRYTMQRPRNGTASG